MVAVCVCQLVRHGIQFSMCSNSIFLTSECPAYAVEVHTVQASQDSAHGQVETSTQDDDSAVYEVVETFTQDNDLR